MKRIIINEQDFQMLQDTENPELVFDPEDLEGIPPSAVGMRVINNLIDAIDRFYTVKGLKGGIPGKNARLYEKYNLNELKRELLKIRHSQ
jgi:hypothetical protein